nr:pentapeptide repeat-containing protein [Rothia sp. RSM42]
MLECERSYQRGQENLVPSDKASSAPESPVTPKDQEKPWYIRHFTKLLIGFGLGGGAIALLLPWMLWLLCGMSSGSSDQLRLHLLYITGGIIAVLTLLQTNWKNQGDRLKIDADIKKNEQDAEKNERDHIRQVHAERRSRYTKAVEQLADEKAAVRLGGIYTLVGLVDEWLTDDTLGPEEQQKEGQVIINNLCAYIRSPFVLAERRENFEQEIQYEKEPEGYSGDFIADKSKFREEQEVRQTIFTEMSTRLSKINEDEEMRVIPGTWSNFDFSFIKALIFYPLDTLTFENPNFYKATFYGDANFYLAKFIGEINFRSVNFKNSAYFPYSHFEGNVTFASSHFEEDGSFFSAKFSKQADFSRTTFMESISFGQADFNGHANFSQTTFHKAGQFAQVHFSEIANFAHTRFLGDGDFLKASLGGKADFTQTYFHGFTNFLDAQFTGEINFDKTHFADTLFFSGELYNADTNEKRIAEARFSNKVKPENYIFRASPHSPHKIELGVSEFNGEKFIIPEGTVLFDPDSWDEEKQEYTHVSEPAKPLENSDTKEEKPAE